MAIPHTFDEEGWTTVGRSRRGGDVRVQARNGPDKDITSAQLQREFDRHTKTWKLSSCREKLLRILKRNQMDAMHEITTAVCLASGSFSSLNFESNKRSMLQFVCVLDISREIGRMAATEVSIFAQDPMYTEVDRAFCASNDVTVLDIDHGDASLGKANSLLGPQTVLFEYFMDMGREGIQDLLLASNGLYIGSSFLRHEKTGWSFIENQAEDVKVLVERFQKEHAQRWFPDFEEDPNVFKGLMVYWREAQDSDLEGEGK